MKRFKWNMLHTDGRNEEGELKCESAECVISFLETNKPESAIAITVIEVDEEGMVINCDIIRKEKPAIASNLREMLPSA